jgi:transketolase
MRDTFIAQLAKIAETDKRIMLITGDLGFGVLTEYAKRFPTQYLNAGVAEQNMTGLAVGMAQEGRIVFTYSIGNFPTLRCLEQIRNDAAYHEANVKIVSIGGGFSYGPLGMSHHATEDLAIMRAIPRMTVLSPGCLWEVEEATKALINTPGTCYLRIDKSDAGRTNRPHEEFKLGEPRTLREGSDITFVTTGGILGEVLQAADELRDEGVLCRVLSVHTLKPFHPAKLLNACKETGGIVTIEEHVLQGGLGSLVAETCMDAGVPPRFSKRLGLQDEFVSAVGSQTYLRSACGIGVRDIKATASRVVKSG